MPRLLSILRRTSKITGWLACGLSALLLVATAVLWVRSLGHEEWWRYDCFEPRPDWKITDRAGWGIWREWSAEPIHGRLWLRSGTWAPRTEVKPQTQYRRIPVLADWAKQEFESYFEPGDRRWGDGSTARAWHFAGAGFRHVSDDVDPRIGRPCHEVHTLALPFWMLAVLFALWPGVRLLRWLLKKKRFAAGLCPHCGYDLRATPDRCPECGKNVPPVATPDRVIATTAPSPSRSSSP